MIQADGGTRTASITGAWVALSDCLSWMKSRDMLKTWTVLRDHLAADLLRRRSTAPPVLDLDYAEDSEADTDAQFRHDRRRQHRRNPGAPPRRTRSAKNSCWRCWRWRARASASWSTCRRWRWREPLGSSAIARLTGSRSSSPPTIPASSPRCASCWRPMASTAIRRRARARRAGRNRHHLRRQCPHQGRWPRRRRPNCAAFADDSGLVVDALGGEPGIHSARWAGPDKDFRVAMNAFRRLLLERGATRAGAAQGAFHLGVVRRPGRTAIVEEFEARVDGTSSSGRRAAKPASATIRYFCRRAHDAYFRRDDGAWKSTGCRLWPGPVASRARLRATGGGLFEAVISLQF